jgi:hypothetical protein
MGSRWRRSVDGPWNVIFSFALLFGVMGSYALLETARDTLFLAHLPASKLPWAYLLTAAAVSIAAVISPSLTRKPSRRRSALLLVTVGAAMLAVCILGPRTTFGLYTFYSAVGVAGTVMVVQIWTLIGALFDVVEARRLYAFIAAGGVLGAIGGGLLAARIVGAHGPLALIAVAGAALLPTSLEPLLLRRTKPAASETALAPAPVGEAYRRPYARRLFGLVALTTVATTVSDFLFKSAVAAKVPPASLGSFFAGYQTAMSTIGLVMQLAIAPLLLRRMTAHRIVLVLPALLAVAGIGMAVAPGLAAALIARSVDAALRNSVHRTGTEVLYQPLPLSVRTRVKALVDGVGQRVAQAGASLLVLGMLAVGGGAALLGGVVTASAALAWWVAWSLRRPYVQAFQAHVRAGKLGDPVAAPALDPASVEALVAMLSSPDDARVIAALETLAAHHKARLVPSLLLYHPATEVATRTLDILAAAGRDDFVPLTERLLAHPNPALRAAASRVRAAVLADERALRRLADDAHAEVQAGALVRLVQLGRQTPSEWKRLQRLARRGPHAAQLAVAQAIARMPSPELTPLVGYLAASENRPLQTEAMRALQALGDPRGLVAALQLLAVREVRDEARKVFVAAGPIGLMFLATALHDRSVALDIRRHIPRTLSRFGYARAAAILVDGLVRANTDGVLRYKMLRGLGRMKHNDPRLDLDRGAIEALAQKAIARTATLRRWRRALDGEPATPTSVHLKTLLARKERMAGERLFRFLDLLRPHAGLEHVYDGLLRGDPARRASSRELLEHIVDPALRANVLALVDGAWDAEGRAGARSQRDVLAELRHDKSAAVRALAAELAAERLPLEVRHAA